MKKILLLALPLMGMCFASCEKNNEEEWTDDSPIIQFKDPKFLEALMITSNTVIGGDYTWFQDMNNDGQVSEKEAARLLVHAVYAIWKKLSILRLFKFWIALVINLLHLI